MSDAPESSSASWARIARRRRSRGAKAEATALQVEAEEDLRAECAGQEIRVESSAATASSESRRPSSPHRTQRARTAPSLLGENHSPASSIGSRIELSPLTLQQSHLREHYIYSTVFKKNDCSIERIDL